MQFTLSQKILIGIISILLIAGGIVTAVILRDRASIRVDAESVVAPIGSSTDLISVVQEIPTRKTPIVLDPVPAPDVELDVEREMTAEEKKRLGFPQSAIIRYKWIRPDGDPQGAPISVITNAPAEQPDGDHDGLSDVDEATNGTDPRNPDTDNDGVFDGTEVNSYDTNPKDPTSKNPPTKKQ